MSARMPAWRAILIGPLFPLLLQRKALEVANRRQRDWIVAELMGTSRGSGWFSAFWAGRGCAIT
jgi:hypothetical protein